ncbi:15207_t:CDS:2, partial [Cetraspora pellucida]
VPVTSVVNEVKKCTQNPKLKSPESEPWWKTALTTSYLNIAAPHHKKQWEDKHDKARKYLSDQIGEPAIETELLDCTDKYLIDNIAKKVEKDHKKEAAIAVIQESASDKHEEIVSKQKDDGSIELDDSICKELHATKEEIIDTIREKITNPKLKLPESSSSLATAVNLSYLKNAATKYKADWMDKYNKARDYLSKQIGDVNTEKELLDCADEYVINEITDKVIEEKKKYVIDLKKDEIPKEENPKAKSFFSSLYERAVKLVDQIEKALGLKDKLDDHEKAEALIIVEESASPEKCKEIVADQKDDGCIELSDAVCDELDTPKEEIITTIQPKLTNKKLQLPNLPSILATAINLSYLKKAASQHEGEWKDKYNKARKYLSDQLGDTNAEKELLECTDDYVINNCIKKVIKDKKRDAVATVQESTTLEKCDDIVSNQNNDGSFEVSETICIEIDVPVTKVVSEATKCTQNPKLKSPKSEPWWRTALAISYLNIAASHHKKQWEDKNDKARKYLSDQIGEPATEKELLDCTDKYIIDNIVKKVGKDYKEEAAFTVGQEPVSCENHIEVEPKQKGDSSTELDNPICEESHAPKEIFDTIEGKITNPNLKLPESSSSLATANGTQVQGSFVGDASDSIIKKISILVAVIAIIFGFAFYYEPVDLPIFGNLINTTNLLSRQLVELDIPEYRVTSKFLADVISRHELSSKNSDSVAQYLNQLGDKIIKSGEAIEKMYLTGNYVLKELMAELKSINDEIYQEKVITKQDAIYFVERHEKILTTITKLRDELKMTVNELNDLYNLYNGMHHQLVNGMKDVEFFFDGIKLELMERYRYDTGKLERNFGYLLQIMKKVPDIRHRINNLLSEFNKHRSAVIECRKEWVGLRRRKLVTYEDTKRFEE